VEREWGYGRERRPPPCSADILASATLSLTHAHSPSGMYRRHGVQLKKRREDEITFVDVKQADITARRPGEENTLAPEVLDPVCGVVVGVGFASPWMVTAISSFFVRTDPSCLPAHAQIRTSAKPNKVQHAKHHITSLLAEAQDKQAKLEQKWRESAAIRLETRNKYGWAL